MKTWNSRYVAYAAARGQTPEAMLIADKARHPSGCMAEFMCWINAKWSAFCAAVKRNRNALCQQDHDDFDAWLAA